jgi:AraC-like DNA-binding protein
MPINTNLINLFYIVSVCFSFLATLLLWKNSKSNNNLANKVLSLFFFAIGYSIFGYLLVVSGWIVYLPLLYKTPLPFGYLIYPSLYLYIQLILNNKAAINRKNWLHFIPFFIAIIDLLPFYFMSLKDKNSILSNLLQDLSNTYLVDSGFLPAWTHYVFKQLQSFIYLILIWKLLYTNTVFKKINFQDLAVTSQINQVKNWLITISTWMTLSYVTFLIFMGFTIINPNYQITGIYTKLASIVSSFSIFALCLHVFFHPNVLYGFIDFQMGDKQKKLNLKEIELGEVEIKPTISFEKWAILEQLILEKEYFKKQGMSIERLSIELNISSRQLSFCINYYKKMKFQDYINSLRLQFVISEFQNGTIETKTIEAIGANAGFGSRSSFFLVFKKQMGCTPLEYIKGLTDEEITE